VYVGLTLASTFFGLIVVVGYFALLAFWAKPEETVKPASSPKETAKQPANGQVMLKIIGGLAGNVTAIVEVDGKREEKNWPAAKEEFEITTSAGYHKVTYRSKSGSKYYKKDFFLTVPAAGSVEQTITGVDPDPGANW
jgi:hypothetical protein